MTNTWILIAQGSAAKILQSQGRAISWVHSFSHPSTAQKDTTLHSDRPGRVFASAGEERHALAPPQDPTDREREVFAKEINAYLYEKFLEKQFDQLILSASPELLGHLRSQLDPALKKIIKGEINKDFYSLALPDREIAERIQQALDLPAL